MKRRLSETDDAINTRDTGWCRQAFQGSYDIILHGGTYLYHIDTTHFTTDSRFRQSHNVYSCVNNTDVKILATTVAFQNPLDYIKLALASGKDGVGFLRSDGMDTTMHIHLVQIDQTISRVQCSK